MSHLPAVIGARQRHGLDRLFEHGALQGKFAARVERKTTPIEQLVILPADHVEVDQR